MKKLISYTGGIHIFLEVRPVDAIPGTTYLRVTTKSDRSKIPDEERVKFDICLTPEELSNLKAVLNEFNP